MTVGYECSGHIRDFLHELPKCEHHVHLEGTLGPDLLFPLAERNCISFPNGFPTSVEELEKRYKKFSDLQDFLNHYYIGMSVLIKEQDFFDLAYSYFEKAEKDGLWHSEVFFDPQGHVERGIPIEIVINGFKKACEKAEKELGITTKLIMCLLRHLPSEDGLLTIKSVNTYYEKGWIHGLGLDSSEKPFPPELFENCYSFLKKNFPNIQLTAHAGEEGGPSYVSNSLDLLKVTRIDHGINSIKDEKLMERLANEKILLSICPLSNVKLQVVENVGQLPIAEFIKYGVSFSINSDDPAYFGGYILDNYIAVHESFGFDLETWCLIARNSINGSWCDEKRKLEMLNAVDKVFEKYEKLLSN
ncbi:hypothetical protein PACTADRAFT_33692 [Pachysolen tannophilus NRRL Y-2460]|uniref:Adenine deaminase n=1 Tax=Pachysolen tannophilus NRRL Y-2460 TaxID=669874 RepID=A0A1E4TTU8_PACTA|nr:hypothetical protein PACTADRAFT_33692 [Pachysolen tannophilus NRRL Y-2460]